MKQVTRHVYQIRTPMGEHYVNSHLVIGDQGTALIDTGLRDTYNQVVEGLSEVHSGETSLRAILVTHGHPDHIGSNARLRQRFRVPVIAPEAAISWIENHERQFRQFPAAFPEAFSTDADFKKSWMSMMDAEAPVDIGFKGEIRVRLGENVILSSLHLPGHSAHETGYYESDSQCLILGDAIALDIAGGFPAYEDPTIYRATLERIRDLVTTGHVNYVVAGHFPPLNSQEALALLECSVHRIEEIDRAITQVIQEAERKMTLRMVGEQVAAVINRTYTFQTPWTITGHLRHLREQGIIGESDGFWYAA